jgi:hypothetical protein
MFCIECGTQILENSKFCPHCGKSQIDFEHLLKEKIVDEIIEKEITRQVSEAHKSSIDKMFLKQSIGWYLAWVLLHLALLLIGAKSILSDGYYNDEFYPFGSHHDVSDYDIREFLVYTIFPLLILFIVSMVRHQDEKKTEIKFDANIKSNQLLSKISYNTNNFKVLQQYNTFSFRYGLCIVYEVYFEYGCYYYVYKKKSINKFYYFDETYGNQETDSLENAISFLDKSIKEKKRQNYI